MTRPIVLKAKKSPLDQHLLERVKKAPRGQSDMVRELNKVFKSRGLPVREELSNQA